MSGKVVDHWVALRMIGRLKRHRKCRSASQWRAMGRLRLASITAALMFACSSSAAGATLAKREHRASKCPGAHVALLAEDTRAVVYKAPSSEGLTGHIFACAYGARRSYDLGYSPEGGSAGFIGTGPFALAGSVVAYAVEKSFTSAHSFAEIWVRNLANGELIYKEPNGPPAEPGDVGLGETTAIVVKRDGSVAWITRASEALGSVQVRSIDETGSHLLAASPEIGPRSLALAGSTLYWTQAGKPMSAVLE